MARKKDAPCAICGTLVWRGSTRCRSCAYGDLRHGTRRMYRERGCRCSKCREWQAAKMREYVASVRERDGITPTQKYRPGSTRRTSSNCSKCGAHILALLAEPLCAPCRGNRPGYNIKITRAGRVAIYERDGWACQICTEPVDPDISPNDTWGATLDHIVPRSQGGTDEPENLRLAHRWCNAVRGDLSHYTDDDLRIA